METCMETRWNSTTGAKYSFAKKFAFGKTVATQRVDRSDYKYAFINIPFQKNLQISHANTVVHEYYNSIHAVVLNK